MDRRNECALLIRDPAARDYYVRYFDTLWNGKAWQSGTPAPTAEKTGGTLTVKE
jgi:hypothetical protein